MMMMKFFGKRHTLTFGRVKWAKNYSVVPSSEGDYCIFYFRVNVSDKLYKLRY